MKQLRISVYANKLIVNCELGRVLVNSLANLMPSRLFVKTILHIFCFSLVSATQACSSTRCAFDFEVFVVCCAILELSLDTPNHKSSCELDKKVLIAMYEDEVSLHIMCDRKKSCHSCHLTKILASGFMKQGLRFSILK